MVLYGDLFDFVGCNEQNLVCFALSLSSTSKQFRVSDGIIVLLSLDYVGALDLDDVLVLKTIYMLQEKGAAQLHADLLADENGESIFSEFDQLLLRGAGAQYLQLLIEL